MGTQTTVGIDIGTTSVKAIAADGDGNVVASVRVPHPLIINAAEEMEHDIDAAWRDGVTQAYATVSRDLDVVGVNVAAMVPSLGALTDAGRAAGPGLLYGDRRGRRDGSPDGSNPVEQGELLGFLAWLRANCAEATGSGRAGDGQPCVERHRCARHHDCLHRVPVVRRIEVGRRDGGRGGRDARAASVDRRRHRARSAHRWRRRPAVGCGTIDAMGEQCVAGADNDGDVLVICGTTLITWAVMKGEEWLEKPGLWTIPHTAPGKLIIGGPSNAGVCSSTGPAESRARATATCSPSTTRATSRSGFPTYAASARPSPLRPARLAARPQPHAHAGACRARGLRDCGLRRPSPSRPRRRTDRAAAHRRHGWRRPRRAVGTSARRLHGLARRHRRRAGRGALGTAFIARCVAGLEAQMSDGSRWARIARRIEPDDKWMHAANERYEEFRTLTAGSCRDHAETVSARRRRPWPPATRSSMTSCSKRSALTGGLKRLPCIWSQPFRKRK